MMKNEDIQSTARHIADSILRGESLVGPAEQVQVLLSFSADNWSQYPFATSVVDGVLQYLFEALEPEQVIL